MKTKNFVRALVMSSVIAAPAAAMAGGQAGSVGVGAEQEFTGGSLAGAAGLSFGGVSLNYDGGLWHAGGFVEMADHEGEDNTVIGIGGRFYYHVATKTNADFGIGGGIGLLNVPDGMGDSNNLIRLDPGFQIRAFLVDNVAFSFTGGISIGLGDDDGFALGAVNGIAGVHYYFF